MLCSNRSATVLSTLLAVAALAGCVDPGGRMDDFTNSIKRDGGVINMIDAPPLANIPDVSGTFLISIRISFAPARALEILATTVLTKKTDGTATLDLDGRFLAVADRKPTGDPVVIHGTAVNNAGELTIVKDILFIPKAANPLVRDATVENAKLPGSIKSVDLFCGVVRGHVAEGNVDLEQSEPDNPTTFAAVRVTDADHLPAVNMTVACP